MQASFVDLRKKSSEILRALRRKESITVLYRGRPTAIMQPLDTPATTSAAEHPAFGLWADRDDLVDPAEHTRALRKRRYDAL